MRQIYFIRETKNVFLKKNEEKKKKKNNNNNNNKSYRSSSHRQTKRRRSLAVHRKSEKKEKKYTYKKRSRATNLSIDDDEFTQRTLHCGYFFAKRMATWEAIKPAPPVIKIFFGSYGISS